MPARPCVFVRLLSSRDLPEGIVCTVVARSAIRFHQCGRRNSGHAWASEVWTRQQQHRANTKGIACGGREKSRINWRPYNPNNRIILAVVYVSGGEIHLTETILHRQGGGLGRGNFAAGGKCARSQVSRSGIRQPLQSIT